MKDKVVLVKNCKEAIQVVQGLSEKITKPELKKFINATISYDGKEWCIASGPNLSFDRSGYGATISNAVNDYFDYLYKSV